MFFHLNVNLFLPSSAHFWGMTHSNDMMWGGPPSGLKQQQQQQQQHYVANVAKCVCWKLPPLDSCMMAAIISATSHKHKSQRCGCGLSCTIKTCRVFFYFSDYHYSCHAASETLKVHVTCLRMS